MGEPKASEPTARVFAHGRPCAVTFGSRRAVGGLPVSGIAMAGDQGTVLLELYDEALPQVFGYLRPPLRGRDRRRGPDRRDLPRRRQRHRARQGAPADRRLAHRRGPPQAGRPLAAQGPRGAQAPKVESEPTAAESDDPWDARIDAAHAQEVLAGLGGHHRAALTLRYLDGLPVPEVANHLGRTVHATEALLVRARTAFRNAYGEEVD